MTHTQFRRTEMSRTGRPAILDLASDQANALDREVLDEITPFVEFCEQSC